MKLHEGVLLRLSRRNVVPSDAACLAPLQDHHAGQLRAVVGDAAPWPAAPRDQRIELASYPCSRQRRVRDQRQVLAGEVVDRRHWVHIKAMKFASSVTRTAGAFVQIQHGLFELSDFTMNGPFRGIYLNSGQRTILIENGEITDAVAVTGISIDIHNSGTDVTMRDLVCTINSFAARPANHIRVDLCGDLSMSDVQLFGAEYDMLVDPGTGESVSSIKAVNCWFDGANQNGLIFKAGTGIIKRCSFDMCWFATTAGSAVAFFPADATTDVDGIDFNGSEFYDAGNGIFTGGASAVIKNVQVVGGRIADCTTAGIVIDDVASFQVIGVKIGNSGGFGDNAVGILLGNDADNVLVQDCDLRGNTTAVSGSTTGTNVRFINNLGYDGVLTPSQITANQNNYAPTGLQWANVLRLSTDASRNITGITAPGWGKRLVVMNVGSNAVVLKDEDCSSTAANRVALNGDLTILGDESAILNTTRPQPAGGWSVPAYSVRPPRLRFDAWHGYQTHERARAYTRRWSDGHRRWCRQHLHSRGRGRRWHHRERR